MNYRSRLFAYSILWLSFLLFTLLFCWMTREGSVLLAFLSSSAFTGFLVWRDWSQWQKGSHQEHHSHTDISALSENFQELDQSPTWSEFWASDFESGIPPQILTETIGPLKVSVVPSLTLVFVFCYLIGTLLNMSLVQILVLALILGTCLYFIVFEK